MGNILIDNNGNALLSNNKALEITSAIDSNIQAENIKKDVTILGVTGTYEGNGGSSIINFTINNVSYQANSGTEWYDWVSSSYNTGGFFCDEHDQGCYVRHSGNGAPTVSYNNVSERPWNLIVSGRAYYYALSGGTND